DGKGYPHGLAGNDIPLMSRIITLVDSFDAMTQDRPYQKGISTEKAIIEIQNNAEQQFDPHLAKIFVEQIL
ncbi:MAG: two-component system response regulator, partial [Erysipelotrichaceae bacterium]|nr:two-component system response regulator [Erysipelotrichaceae bacterium]